MQGFLHTTTVQWGACQLSPLQTAQAIGEQQHRVLVRLPESAQDQEGCLWQRDKAIPIAFGVPNMYPVARGIDVGHRQGQSFAQAQAQAVQDEIKHPVAQGAGGRK